LDKSDIHFSPRSAEESDENIKIRDNTSDIEFLSSHDTSMHTKESNKKRKHIFNTE
jgi:hypothetical protein